MQSLICAFDTESGTYVFPESCADSIVCPECRTNVKKDDDHFVHSRVGNTECMYLNEPTTESHLLSVARRALIAYLQSGAVLYISYMCKCMWRFTEHDPPHGCTTCLKLFDGYSAVLDEEQDIVLYDNDEPRNRIVIRNSCQPEYPELHDSPYLFEFCVDDVFRVIRTGGFIQCLRIYDIPDRCDVCRLHYDELGAFRADGTFCLATDTDVADKVGDVVYKCQSCSEPVELYKTVFRHIDLTPCHMYTDPTDAQYTKNTLLKVDAALRNRRLTEVYWECDATYFSGFDPHINPISILLNHTDGDTVNIHWDDECVQLYNSEGELKYEFRIRKAHHPLRTYGNKHGRFLIEHDTVIHDNEINVLYDGSYCDHCKKLQSMEHLLKRLPTFERKGMNFMFTCLLCRKRRQECLNIDDKDRPICHDCLETLEPRDLEPLTGNVWLFIDETDL